MATTINDLVAAVRDIVGPLASRAEVEAAVRAERTMRYEDHEEADILALAHRVHARLASVPS